jgi:hypothetical protein
MNTMQLTVKGSLKLLIESLERDEEVRPEHLLRISQRLLAELERLESRVRDLEFAINAKTSPRVVTY